MDLWSALGMSREAGLLGVGVGLVVALLLAATIAYRRRGEHRPGALGLDDR